MNGIQTIRSCWCGNAELFSYGAGYGECRSCGTLVSLKEIAPEDLQVHDDETDFYGRRYWLSHQMEDIGLPDIYSRARNDLAERNLHWLKTLLKFRLPHAKILEIGCSHGSFVALLNQAGYEASGVELSHWVVEFGRRTFHAPISEGKVESLGLSPHSFDVIVLMDVLEHLYDPVSMMAHCLSLLKQGGMLLVQTPQFKEGRAYGSLVDNQDRFLEMLIPDEHIYLFSDRSVTQLFGQLGTKHIRFEPAIFSHYDMFFTVSREQLQTNTDEEVDAALLATPGGRMALALLDLRERELELLQRYQRLESDYRARCEQVETLTQMLRQEKT